MDNAAKFTEPAPSMGPPPIRPSARSQVPVSEVTDHHSRPHSQTKRLGQRSRSVKNRREIDVVLPHRETTHDHRPETTGNNEEPIETEPIRTAETSVAKTTVQEVHKIILSGISTVEFLHTEDSRIALGPPTAPSNDTGGNVQEVLTSPKKASPKCLYRVEYRDEDDVLVGEEEGISAVEVKIADKNEAVIEVVTTFSVKRKSQFNKVDFNPALTKATNEGTEVRINSSLLANALRAVVTYYPGESLLEEPLVFEAPYQLLFHYRKDLELYKDNHPDKHDLEYRDECNQHIDILLDFLHQCLDGDVDKEEARNQQSPPMCTFEYLWTIFRPGVDVYARDMSLPFNSPRSVYVVSSIEGGTGDSEILPYKIRMWNMMSDGETLRRSPKIVEIMPFDGEKEISSISALPLDFLEDTKRKALEERLVARGKRYYEYTSISHKHFHGYTLSHPRRFYDVDIMLDTAQCYLDYQYDEGFRVFEDTIDEDNDKSIGVWGCGCTACRKTKNTEGKVRFSGYDRIPLKKSATKELSDHQCLICPPKILGYALKQRAWQGLDMDAIGDVKFDKDAINDLILEPEENKGLLKALAKGYAQKPADDDFLPPTIVDGITVVQIKPNSWTADSVGGKGEGQVILLHGPPGVGKTCTAETVAEFTERPLLSLTCSDIGTRATEVETNLRKWMKKARRWGAILLIDEADVYLEERNTQGFERNSLVSVFLRNLEYYQGILFLTTNRVGVFDEAFTSRIHITMFYPGFNEARRIKVWKAMIAKLTRERKDIRIPYDLNKYIEKDEDLKKVKWNGREIRNAFQTTVALAEFQASEEKSTDIELKIEYLDQVVKMSKRFKEYLEGMPDGDVAKKAWRYGKRNDNFDST